MTHSLAPRLRTLRLLLGVTALCLGLGLLCLAAAGTVEADSETLGSISGVVRDSAGNPLPNVEVQLYRSTFLYYYELRTTTDQRGAYAFGLLPTAFYRLAFIAPSAAHPSPQYYQAAVGLADAADVAVAGVAVTGVDMVMHAGGVLRGRLVDEDGAPADQVTVRPTRHLGGAENLPEGESDANGNFVVTGLPSGYYTLYFVDAKGRYFSRYYDNTDSAYRAIIVGVGAGGVVENLNSTLYRGASISGKVTDGAGVGLAGIEVSVYTTWHYPQHSAYTDANGNYTVGGLAAGQYLIAYQDPSGVYANSSYSDLENEDGVKLAERERKRGINVSLVKWGVAQGTVTNGAGQPLANVLVRARVTVWPGSSTRTTYTNDQGRYALSGLSLNEYYLDFSQPTGLYQAEFYSNALTIATATPITVFPGEIITQVDAALALGGAITGVVTTVDGTSLGDVKIMAIPQQQPLTATTTLYTITTAASFTYTIGGLPPGDYLVALSGMGVSEYYDNHTQRATATPVRVTAGQFTRQINAILGDGADSATITGTVRSATGEPLDQVLVSVYCLSPCENLSVVGPQPTWQYLRSTVTADNGTYQLAGLLPQRYRLRFQPTNLIADESRYAFEYYDNASDLAAATELDLQPNMVLRNIDATLGPGGAITGMITYDGGSYPVAGGQVQFYHWDGYSWNDLGQKTVGAITGVYTQSALPTGRYRVAATGSLANDAYHLYYGGTTIFTDAHEITVTTGLTTADIDLDLPSSLFQNAAITGLVTAAGKPLANIQVTLYVANDKPSSRTITDARGHYRLGNLSTGAYFLGFVDPSATYAISYTGGITTLYHTSTEWLQIDAQEVLTNVNAHLLPGGAIRGRVVDETGRGVGQVAVMVYRWVNKQWREVLSPLQSDNAGFYTTPGLHPGYYRLYFTDPLSRYSSRYYGDRPFLRAALRVPVQAGQTTAGIDATMRSRPPTLYLLYTPIIMD